MAALAENIGILFRIKADSSDARKDIGGVKSEITQLGSSAAAAGGGMAALAGPATAAVTAVLAIGAAAVTAAVGLFNLTQSASEYGSIIFDAKEKTGLAAATLSTLKVNADNAGSSFEQVTGGVEKFTKLIGQAAEGNEKAQASLKELGVDSYDLETALNQATKAIFEAEDGTEQITLAQKAFGKSGADLIPVIKAMGGDLAAAQKEAERLGITLRDEDVEAADAFGDSLGLLKAQAAAASVAFTADLMPVLTSFFTSASEWYARNQNEVRVWGSIVTFVVTDFARGVRVAFNAIRDHAFELRASLAVVTGGLSELVFWAGQLVAQLYRARAEKEALESGKKGQEAAGFAGAGPDPRLSTPRGGGGGGARGGGGAKSAANDAAQKAKADLDAQIRVQQDALRQAEEAYKNSLGTLHEIFADYGDADALTKGMQEASRVFRETATSALAEIREFERRKAEIDKESAAQAQQRDVDAGERARKVAETIFDEETKVGEKIGDANLKLADRRRKIEAELVTDLKRINQERQDSYIESEERMWDELIANTTGYFEEQNKLRGEAINGLTLILNNEKQRRLDALNDEKAARKREIEETIRDETAKQKALADLDELYKQRALLTEDEFQARLREIQDKYAVPVSPAEGKSYGPFSSLIDGWNSFIDLVASTGPTLTETLQAVGGLFVDMFNQMTEAVGGLIQNWVLMGSTGPAAMRKILAASLASLAAQAAVRAIFELAAGFAALFLNPAEAAAHFKAAALFGSIAVGAAIGGRVAAGDLFNNRGASSSFAGQAGTATGNSSAQQNNYTTPFRGMQQNGSSGQSAMFTWMEQSLKESRMVNAELADAVRGLESRITSMSPEDVLAVGAERDPGIIGNAMETHLNESGAAGAGNFFRASGLAVA